MFAILFGQGLAPPLIVKFVECHIVYIALSHDQCFESGKTTISPLGSHQLVRDIANV